ncbi:MAG: sn-glycerol-3-phosphate ABC transporter ATP-binding protein UgpC [Rubellimicrobium sp.]|nr:sn-glycerol-3-phosphate ABC transporter ATP-binding protein UgpC [Rubellimicrobium sp.]
MADLELRGVEKSFGGMTVINGVDLSVGDGEFVVFVGPSGCGKSTLLRMIAGLEHITGGEIAIGGRVVNRLSAPERGIAMVFQSYALYPHMSVRQNMSFGLELQRRPKAEIARKVQNAADILQLGPYLDRMPKALSGGQRQRVAIGRAIVREPEVFLFDEPLSNLDAALRGQTRLEIARLHARLGATMIYVTHDQTEAMTLADRIVVLNAGRIEQVGTPLELYRKPVNAFVAGFIGGQTMNFLPLTDGALPLAREGASVELGAQAVMLGIRPEHLRLAPQPEADLLGRVDVIEEFGEFSLLHLELVSASHAGAGSQPRLITVKVERPVAAGETVGLTIERDHIHAFDASGRVLAA